MEKVMFGNKASRLEGIKWVGPFKCLLVKLNCTMFLILKQFRALINYNLGSNKKNKVYTPQRGQKGQIERPPS